MMAPRARLRIQTFVLLIVLLALCTAAFGQGHAPAAGDDHAAAAADVPRETPAHAGDAHAAQAQHADTHGDGQGEGHAVSGHHGNGLGEKLPLWSVIPFAGILLSIAILPLLAPNFWHHHFPKLSAMWALVFAVPFLFEFKGAALYEIVHIYLIDYIPFIILLWGLFTVSGGILVRGRLRGTPVLNCIMLAIGTALASWIGTTGAAMVMIRPLMRANAERNNKVHVVVFFIFLVANIGGSLTPLGDPPLFLGFLHGVPFFWTMHLLPHMLTCFAVLMTLFFFLDRHYYLKDCEDEACRLSAHTSGFEEKIRVLGLYNFLFLGGILGAVLMSGSVDMGTFHVLGVEVKFVNTLRDGLIIGMGALSLLATPRKLRYEENEFTWFPIKEVAYLFAGIFMTIIPALAILKAGEQGALAFLIRAVREPVHYFWVTGALSSFLDNAPTYLTFFNTALGRFYPGMPEAQAVPLLTTEKIIYLEAIAAGAVFMGAMTYIGNAPNFMVRSIAEEAGVKMPSFFGYMIKWSIPILVPAFGLITLIFFLF